MKNEVHRGNGYISTLTGNPKHRMIQLDVLRGVAILLVIGHHEILSHENQAGSLKWLATLWWRFGWSGVDLFFVLSGFLVGGLLFKELRTRSRIDACRFLIRRGFKIWPSYYVYIMFVLILAVMRSDFHAWSVLSIISFQVKKLLPNFLHLQNYLGTVREHTWSLSVEEHFYLILPFALVLVASRRNGNVASNSVIPLIAFGLIVGCNGVRYLTNGSRPFTTMTHTYPTHIRIDGLFFGVLLGYLYHFKTHLLESIARHRVLLVLLGVALISPMMIVDREVEAFVSTFGLTMLYLGYGCILIVMMHTSVASGGLGRFFSTTSARALAFIGYFSYTIYLWHLDIAWYPMTMLVRHGLLKGLMPEVRWVCIMIIYIYVITAVAAGAVLGILVEKPALALRDRLFPARADALAKPAESLSADTPSVTTVSTRQESSFNKG